MLGPDHWFLTLKFLKNKKKEPVNQRSSITVHIFSLPPAFIISF